MVESTQLQLFLLAHDLLSSLVYSMITHTPPVAGNLSIKILVARQRPTNTHTYTHTNTHTHTHTHTRTCTYTPAGFG